MGEKKLTRGLDCEKLEKCFKYSPWFKFYKENKDKDELFLGIRNNYVNIYYRGMSMAKVKSPFENAYIADKYAGIEKTKNKSTSKNEPTEHSITYTKFENDYENIKNRIDKHINDGKSLLEKDTQCKLIYRNNKNCYNGKSDWICIDMEYAKQRKNQNDGDRYGRFDIIAVNVKNYRVALIELKVGRNSLGGESGLRKHAKDWNNFLKNNLFNKSDKRKDREDYLVKEITNIIKNKACLDSSFPIHVDKSDFDEKVFENIEPEFYFLICSGDSDIDSIKNTSRKYTFKAQICQEKYGLKVDERTKNIQDELTYDITEKGSGPLYCKFLFAKNNGEDIQDIIDDKSYECDLR